MKLKDYAAAAAAVRSIEAALAPYPPVPPDQEDRRFATVIADVPMWRGLIAYVELLESQAGWSAR